MEKPQEGPISVADRCEGVVAELQPSRIHIVRPCVLMSGTGKPSPARYRMTKGFGDMASLHKRGLLRARLEEDMSRIAPPGGSPGRPAVSADPAIQFCLTLRLLFGLPLRQTTGMVAGLPMMGLRTGPRRTV